MSDLQCPATILLVPNEAAAVSDMQAQRLALVVIAEDLGPDAPSFACETSHEPLTHGAALRARIAELADLYRGEHVAIIASAQAIGELLHQPVPPKEAITVAVDSDGWRISSR